MAYPVPSIDEFKAQFRRDFPYSVPAFGAAGGIVVTAGAISSVAVLAGGYGYKTAPTVAVVDEGVGGAGAQITATVASGKVTAFAVVAGGSGYVKPVLSISGGAGDDTNLDLVIDDDIRQAQADAGMNVNPDLFSNDVDWTRAFNYLTAHCLVEKLLAAGEGLASQYNWLTSSKTVGDVSESFEIPDQIKDSPFLAALSKTRYGALYLQIISPLLIGNVMTTFRQSLP